MSELIIAMRYQCGFSSKIALMIQECRQIQRGNFGWILCRLIRVQGFGNEFFNSVLRAVGAFRW